MANTINGSRPLDFAAESGDLPLITFLFKHGADIHANTDDSLSVIWAVSYRHLEAAMLLIDLGSKTVNEALKQHLELFKKNSTAGSKNFRNSKWLQIRGLNMVIKF